jgi:hypothetical protein
VIRPRSAPYFRSGAAAGLTCWVHGVREGEEGVRWISLFGDALATVSYRDRDRTGNQGSLAGRPCIHDTLLLSTCFGRDCCPPLRPTPLLSTTTTASPALCCVLLKSTLKFGELGELGLRKRKRKKRKPADVTAQVQLLLQVECL